MQVLVKYGFDKVRTDTETSLIEANAVVAQADGIVVKGATATDGISVKYADMKYLKIGESEAAAFNQKAVAEAMGIPAENQTDPED